MTMTYTDLTFKQFCDLRSEFVDFKLKDMTNEELINLLKKFMINEVENLGQQDLKDRIDEYDEFLYDILVSYVKDEDNSYEVLQQFFDERHADDWVNDY
tara:strand:+ start:240 stop:536 length:297 start_codon:yes stop_codon:yes gene_type:complete